MLGLFMRFRPVQTRNGMTERSDLSQPGVPPGRGRTFWGAGSLDGVVCRLRLRLAFLVREVRHSVARERVHLTVFGGD